MSKEVNYVIMILAFMSAFWLVVSLGNTMSNYFTEEQMIILIMISTGLIAISILLKLFKLF